MATMNISLPQQMKDWIEARVADSGRYANVSDYMRDLIREEQDRHAQAAAWLEEKIQEGLDSGPAVEADLRKLMNETLNAAEAAPKTAAE